MRATLRLFAMIGALLTGIPTVSAQTEASYPTRPIQLIVTVPPGGAADFVARLVGGKLAEQLGQSVIVVNKAGASGSIATDFVAKAKPDGYTLLQNAISTHGIGPHLIKQLPYDPVKDFAPIGLIAQIPLVMVVHDSLAAKSVKDLVALAKAAPGKISYASPGNGGAPHLSAELFKLTTGTNLLHVPYKGSGPAVIDLSEGRVQVMIDGLPALLQHVNSGKLRPIAAASLKRNPLLPNVPTFAELGLSGMEVALWYGLAAPAGTPDPIVKRLNAELQKVLALPAVTEAFAKQSVEAAPGTPEQFRDFMLAELARWKNVVDKAGIQPE
jgi:tripartite-type tricarboxylate transporter receptor subunit TctC